MLENSLYHYRATYRRTIDGDTIVLDIDLGMGVWLHDQSVRLFGINTPELRSDDEGQRKKAIAARDFVAEALSASKHLTTKTHKDRTGKYGRLLADIYTQDGQCLNDMLVDAGLAEQVVY